MHFYGSHWCLSIRMQKERLRCGHLCHCAELQHLLSGSIFPSGRQEAQTKAGLKFLFRHRAVKFKSGPQLKAGIKQMLHQTLQAEGGSHGTGSASTVGSRIVATLLLSELSTPLLILNCKTIPQNSVSQTFSDYYTHASKFTSYSDPRYFGALIKLICGAKPLASTYSSIPCPTVPR